MRKKLLTKLFPPCKKCGSEEVEFYFPEDEKLYLLCYYCEYLTKRGGKAFRNVLKTMIDVSNNVTRLDSVIVRDVGSDKELAAVLCFRYHTGGHTTVKITFKTVEELCEKIREMETKGILTWKSQQKQNE